MLGKKSLILFVLAQQVVHKHQALMEHDLVRVFRGQLVVQFLEHLLRPDFQNVQNSLIGSQVLSKYNLLDIILVRFGLVGFFVRFGLNALEDFFDELFLWRDLGLGEKVGGIAVVQQGLVFQVQLALIEIVRLRKGVVLQSAVEVLSLLRAFGLFRCTLKSLLVSQVLLELRQELSFAFFFLIPLQVDHLD